MYPGEVMYTGSGESHSIANEGTEPLEFVSIIMTYQPPER
jgi:mannose-6-phosphate isomerase-like protein (cupin superfamily)